MDNSNKPVRVRFAPSPTGPLHIGGVRTALFNHFLAQKSNGTMILRIEDTDQNRFVPGAEEYIIESLEWVGIQIHEGPHVGGPHAPYRQSERKNMYAQYAYDLIDKGLAYYAFDTEEDLETMRKRLEASGMQPAYDSVSRNSMVNSLTLPADEVKLRIDRGDNFVIRIKLPRKEEVRFYDIIRGWVVVNSAQLDDKVLLKGDGMPTYHLANVVDDYLMQISHVIRGEEWLPSAPLHVMLYKYLGWENAMPQFAHLPLLLKPEGNGKLSKRDGDRLGFPVFPLNWTDPKTGEKSSGYRESGYSKEAVVNMLTLLGWHPSGNQEVFSMDELIDQFTLEKVSKSGAKFDVQKAFWFNHHYLQNQPLAQLRETISPMLTQFGFQAPNEYIEKVIGLIREKVNFSTEIPQKAQYFFKHPVNFPQEVIEKKWNSNTNGYILTFTKEIEKITDWSSNEIEGVFKNVCENLGIKTGELMLPLRVVISGESSGPPIWEIFALLGKSICLERLNLGIEKISFIGKEA